MRRILHIILFSFIGLITYGQETVIRCTTDEQMEIIYQEDPSYPKRIEESFSRFNELKKILQTRHKGQRNTITIPVHVIIVHPPGQAVGIGNNLSLARIESQIQVLNEDFGRYNADSGNTPNVFSAEDTGIQFCLASVDPNGNPTDGITRYATNQNFSSNETSIKNATRWPRANYMNVWVAPLSGGTLGFAYLPTTTSLPNASLDGVAVNTSNFGGPGFAPPGPYALGRTLTHEVGHFLGLQHIWRNGGCGQDDGISDTPVQDDENYGCPNHPSPSCTNSGDMFMNYMDYTNDNCMNAFTAGQGAYMNLILSTSRASLASSSATACAFLAPLAASVEDTTNPLCFNENSGTATISSTGGNAPITYTIAGVGSNTNGVFTGLGAGSYTVTVSDSGNQSVQVNFTLTNPSPLSINWVDDTPTSCFNTTDGIIQVVANGGTTNGGSYFYQLEAQGNAIGVFTGLAPGNYTAFVYDLNQCEASVNVVVTAPAPILITTNEILGVLCFGQNNGAASFSGNGGIGNLSYSIGNGNQANGNFSNLTAGGYTLAVTDSNGCTAYQAFAVSSPSQINTSSALTTSNPCVAPITSTLQLNSSGGTGNYSYSINGGGFQNQTMYSGLQSGLYSIVTKDASDCQITTEIEVINPEEFAAAPPAVTNVSCFGDTNGIIVANASGGALPYQYQLVGTNLSNNDGYFENLGSGIYTIQIIDQNGCTIQQNAQIIENSLLAVNTSFNVSPDCFGGSNGSVTLVAQNGVPPYSYSIDQINFGPSPVFEGLSAGSYTFLVNDANNCKKSTIVEVTQPNPIEAQAQIQDITCFNDMNGAISISANGGTGSITISLGNGSFENSAVFDNLDAGTYSVILTDENGCTSELSNLSITQPEELSLTFELLAEANCSQTELGAVQIIPAGGTGPYVFKYQSTENENGLFEGLPSGPIKVTVTDANKCFEEIDLIIPQSDGFTISASEVNNVSCNGANDGEVDLQFDGGTEPFAYILNDNPVSNLENLSPGLYTLTVSDASGSCTQELEFEITEPEKIVGEIILKTYDENTGLGGFTVSHEGGVAPFTYRIEERGFSQSSNVFTGVPLGPVVVIIIDANGCEHIVSETLTSVATPLSESLVIFPNPFHNEFKITMLDGSFESEGYRVKLYDVTGRNLPFSMELDNSVQMTIRISDDAPSGLYLLGIQSAVDKGTTYWKLVKI